MIYLIYLLLAIAVVYLSNKASIYVDLIDKKTSLSGAFIGGVLLSAVTSLPELFTSISATLLLDKPGLCIGNILGSDLFNIAVLAVLILFAYNSFKNVKVAKSHITITIFVILIYLILLLNMFNILNFEILTVNVTSIIIVFIYFMGIRYMASDESGESDEPDNSNLTVKQIVIRFILVSIGIVGLSIAITYTTDIIATKLNLGAGFAGALFLGIATSLPEVASTTALFRIKNYNIAIGNIIGSNLFNFIILSIADILYLGNGVYDYSDPKTINLLIMGLIATPLMLIMMKWKTNFKQIVCPLGVIISYILFLLI